MINEVERHLSLSKVILWSDGCAAQFRSRFVFKLLSNYRSDLSIEWHYNEAHHGKGPMDGIGGTIKNVVFRQVKCGKIIVNSAKDFCDAANSFVPSITSLFQKEKDLLCEPEDIEKSSSIPATLQIHKLVRYIRSEGGATIDFYFLSNRNEPCYSQSYSSKQNCGHVEREFESLALFRSVCAHCMEKYLTENELEDCLNCPLCHQWFHEKCFEL